jgi:C4-dicarboxylate-specific signal transduction histidine kinase
LMQVLMNGVKNGVESLATISDRVRQLRIRTVPLEPDAVAIRIEDSGCGLDPVMGDRVFEPFVSTKPRGMGLGLSICKSIIEGHDGALSLLPGSPCGAIFEVELPALDPVGVPRDLRPSSGASGTVVSAETARPSQTSVSV